MFSQPLLHYGGRNRQVAHHRSGRLCGRSTQTRPSCKERIMVGTITRASPMQAASKGDAPAARPERKRRRGAGRALGVDRLLDTIQRGIEEQFTGLMDSLPDAIVLADAAGRIVLANTQAEQLFGYGPEELVGRLVETLVPERYHAAHVGHRAVYAANPRPRAMGAGLELYGQRKDGSEFPVEISLAPLETEAGVLVITAIRDST